VIFPKNGSHNDGFGINDTPISPPVKSDSLIVSIHNIFPTPRVIIPSKNPLAFFNDANPIIKPKIVESKMPHKAETIIGKPNLTLKIADV